MHSTQEQKIQSDVRTDLSKLGVGKVAGTSYSRRHSEDTQSLTCPFSSALFLTLSSQPSFLSFSLRMSENGYKLYYFAVPTSRLAFQHLIPRRENLVCPVWIRCLSTRLINLFVKYIARTYVFVRRNYLIIDGCHITSLFFMKLYGHFLL